MLGHTSLLVHTTLDLTDYQVQVLQVHKKNRGLSTDCCPSKNHLCLNEEMQSLTEIGLGWLEKQSTLTTIECMYPSIYYY